MADAIISVFCDYDYTATGTTATLKLPELNGTDQVTFEIGSNSYTNTSPIKLTGLEKDKNNVITIKTINGLVINQALPAIIPTRRKIFLKNCPSEWNEVTYDKTARDIQAEFEIHDNSWGSDYQDAYSIDPSKISEISRSCIQMSTDKNFTSVFSNIGEKLNRSKQKDTFYFRAFRDGFDLSEVPVTVELKKWTVYISFGEFYKVYKDNPPNNLDMTAYANYPKVVFSGESMSDFFSATSYTNSNGNTDEVKQFKQNYDFDFKVVKHIGWSPAITWENTFDSHFVTIPNSISFTAQFQSVIKVDSIPNMHTLRISTDKSNSFLDNIQVLDSNYTTNISNYTQVKANNTNPDQNLAYLTNLTLLNNYAYAIIANGVILTEHEFVDYFDRPEVVRAYIDNVGANKTLKCKTIPNHDYFSPQKFIEVLNKDVDILDFSELVDTENWLQDVAIRNTNGHQYVKHLVWMDNHKLPTGSTNRDAFWSFLQLAKISGKFDYIPSHCFLNRSIEINAPVKILEQYALVGCTITGNIKPEVLGPFSLAQTTIGKELLSSIKIAEVGAMWQMKGTGTLELPKIQTIGNRALAQTEFTCVKAPKIELVDTRAFSKSKLVTFESNEKPAYFGMNCFEKCNQVTIKVTTLAKHKASYPWNDDNFVWSIDGTKPILESKN